MVHCILIKFSPGSGDTIFPQSCRGCWDADTWHPSRRLILAVVTVPLPESLLLSLYRQLGSHQLRCEWTDRGILQMESVYKPLGMQYFYEGNDEHWALNKSGFFWQPSAFLPTKVCSVEAECGSVFVSMLSILGRAGTLCYTGVPPLHGRGSSDGSWQWDFASDSRGGFKHELSLNHP